MFGRKKKKKPPVGKMMKLFVNGVETKAVRLRVFPDKDGLGMLEIITVAENQTLHYEQCKFTVMTTDGKKVSISAEFDSAERDGKVYKYLFKVFDYTEVFA